MQEINENIITIFRKKQSVAMDKFHESLLAYGIDPDRVQVIISKEAPDIVTFFRVHTLPTVLLFTDGEEIQRLTAKEINTNTLIQFLK